MSCVSDEMFAAWVSGELDAREIERIEDHAADCPTCRGMTLALFGVIARGSATIGAVGATIGRYRVEAPLGEGAMGIVLRGRDPVLERDVAIKLIKAPADRARLLDEAKLLAAIDHPNVVRVYDAGDAGDEVFVAMEYIVGSPLGVWLSESPRTLAERLAVLCGIGAGLAAIHEAGVVHRDIKPDNIVVRGTRAVIVDFGLARSTPGGGEIAGTPRFLAPEVLSGAAATAAADQYAWWMVVDDLMHDVALPPRRRRALDAAIARGRAAPEERFATLHDAVAGLEMACRPPRRRRLALVAGSAGAIAIAGLALMLLRPAATDECDVPAPAEWSPVRRLAISSRLIAAGIDRDAVIAVIDTRARRTTALRAAACSAARAGDADARVRALHEELCASETWRRTDSALFWMESRDREQVHVGVDNIAMLLPLDRCTGGAPLGVAARPELPIGPAVNALEDTRRALRHAFDKQPREWIARLRELELHARPLGYQPLLHGIHMDLSDALSGVADYASARHELETALAIAEAAGDDEPRLWTMLSLLQNARLAGTGDITALERAADAAAARLASPAVTAELRYYQASLRNQHAEFAAALAALREANRLIEPITFEVTQQRVGIELMLAATHQLLGDAQAAQVAFDRAYADARRRFGETAIETLVVRASRAANAIDNDKPDLARDELAIVDRLLVASYGEERAELVELRAHRCDAELALRSENMIATCTRAVETAERVLPADDPDRAWIVGLQGIAYAKSGQPALAIAPLERASAAELPSPLLHAEILGNLALALHDARRADPRGLRVAADALKVLRDDPHDTVLVERLLAAYPTLSVGK